MPSSSGLTRLPRALLGRPSVRSAWQGFALSRVVVFGLFLLVARFPGFIPGAPAAPARLHAVVTQADAQWYLDIARNGYEVLPYEQSRQHNWAFYPGWPLLWRGAAAVTGEYPMTGMALATLLFLGALVVLHEVAVALGASEEVARRTVLYTALWPTSFFFSMCTTESLFLLLSAGSLLAGARGVWLAAGVLGAFASATRPNGIVLAPVLGLLYWHQRGGRLRADALAILFVPAGVLALMARLHQATGNAFASFAIQVRWSKVPSFPLLPLWRWLKAPYVAEHWNFAALNFAAGALGLWAAAHFARRRSWVLAAYALLGTLMPLSSRSLQGLLRYTMVLVPVPLALAEVTMPTARQEALLAVLAALLGVMTMLGVGGYPFGLA